MKKVTVKVIAAQMRVDLSILVSSQMIPIKTSSSNSINNIR